MIPCFNLSLTFEKLHIESREILIKFNCVENNYSNFYINNEKKFPKKEDFLKN